MKSLETKQLSIWMFILGGVVVLTLGQSGCAKQRHLVIAATGTNIGVEISENPATQGPQAKLGYQRTELAIVPTNRSAEEKAKDASLNNGAKDSVDVLMELRYGGIFDKGATSGVYQRLAVGKTAVSRPGADLMFAKDASGTVTSDTTKAIRAVKAIPASDPVVRSSLACLSGFRQKDSGEKEVDAAIQSVTKTASDPGGLSWDDLVDNPDAIVIEKIFRALGKKITDCR